MGMSRLYSHALGFDLRGIKTTGNDNVSSDNIAVTIIHRLSPSGIFELYRYHMQQLQMALHNSYLVYYL